MQKGLRNCSPVKATENKDVIRLQITFIKKNGIANRSTIFKIKNDICLLAHVWY